MGDDELLREASRRLRTLANEATPGRWQIDGPWWHDVAHFGPGLPSAMVSAGDKRKAVLLVPPRTGSDDDARYAVAMQPAVAVALADLLDEAACAPSLPYPVAAKALAVARAVLGDA